jgi:hypothetical protein
VAFSFNCLLKNILFQQDEAETTDTCAQSCAGSLAGSGDTSRRLLLACVRSVDFPTTQLFVPILNAVACWKRSEEEGCNAGFITQSHKNRRDGLAITL